MSRVIKFTGTLKLAKEIFESNTCSLERRINEYVLAMVRRGINEDMVLSIFAKKRAKFWSLHKMNVCVVRINVLEKAEPFTICDNVIQRILDEKFYAGD